MWKDLPEKTKLALSLFGLKRHLAHLDDLLLIFITCNSFTVTLLH